MVSQKKRSTNVVAFPHPVLGPINPAFRLILTWIPRIKQQRVYQSAVKTIWCFILYYMLSRPVYLILKVGYA